MSQTGGGVRKPICHKKITMSILRYTYVMYTFRIENPDAVWMAIVKLRSRSQVRSERSKD